MGENTYLNLIMDEGPGLKIDQFVSNNSDMLTAIETLWNTMPVVLGNLSTDFRLYPADISRPSNITLNGKTTPVIKEDWRLLLEPLSIESKSELPSQNLFAQSYQSWQTAESIYYGGKPIDRLVFVKEGEDVVGVQLPFLRVNLTRSD